MAGRVVLDASVAVKWFHEEDLTDEALTIRDAADKGRIELMVPAIFPYEVINALKRTPSLFDEEQLKSAGESIELRDLLGEKVERGDLNAVLELTFRYSINPYDASYLLMAKRFKTRLITADKKLVDKVGKEDLVLFLGSGKVQGIV